MGARGGLSRIQPCIDRLPSKPPMPPHLLARDPAPLGELADRAARDLRRALGAFRNRHEAGPLRLDTRLETRTPARAGAFGKPPSLHSADSCSLSAGGQCRRITAAARSPRSRPVSIVCPRGQNLAPHGVARGGPDAPWGPFFAAANPCAASANFGPSMRSIGFPFAQARAARLKNEVVTM